MPPRYSTKRTYRRKRAPARRKKKSFPTKRSYPSVVEKPRTDRVAVRSGYTGFGMSPRSFATLYPNKVRLALKWNKVYTVAAGTTDVPTYNHFVLTGLFDPEYAAASSIQPYGFDQIMAHYGHYQVIGAKMVAQFVHNSGNNMVVGCITNPGLSTTYWDTTDEFVNDPRTRYKIIGNEYPRATCVVKYSKKAIYGDGSEAALKGTVSTNPGENYYGSVWSNNMAPGATQAAYDLLVTIHFFAEFTEQLDIAKS